MHTQELLTLIKLLDRRAKNKRIPIKAWHWYRCLELLTTLREGMLTQEDCAQVERCLTNLCTVLSLDHTKLLRIAQHHRHIQ